MANLETITGSLENALARADRRTIQHAWEITNDRRAQPDSREQWFWTADFPLYRVEDGELPCSWGELYSRFSSPVLQEHSSTGICMSIGIISGWNSSMRATPCHEFL